MNLLLIFVKAIAYPLLWILLFLIPTFVVMRMVARSRKAYEEEAKEPFKELPCRMPGESTRLAADALSEKALSHVFALIMAPCLIGLSASIMPATQRLVVAINGGIIVVAVACFCGSRMLRHLRKSWDYRLGAKGEQVVAEELSSLLASEYRIFHDIPFEGFNVDHVVVGPAGVFAIETKTRRKGKAGAKQPAHVVRYDGQALYWPSGKRDTLPIEQAARNARTVAEWLSSSTGEHTRCQAIVTLPGWFIEKDSSKLAPVVVAATKGLNRFIPHLSQESLTESQISRITHQLSERCRTAARSAVGE